MKKIIATITCLVSIFSINLAVYAAENALACPTGCGGTVVRKYTSDYEGSAFTEDCYLVNGCKVSYIFIYDIGIDECNNCSYSAEFSRQLMDVEEIHSVKH